MDQSDGILWELELLKQATDEMQKGNSQKALPLLNEVLFVNPIQGWHVYYARGLVYANLSNYQKAIEDFDRASKILQDSFNKGEIDIDTFANSLAEILFHKGVVEG
ncbi:tetratricopeptide repeat protein [Planktothrix agardhii]|uniref:tetratricopeptide repeat protein n=1 Tax=Planktothrix agardhii TaxID=1160 RepID=UPI000413F918|nr:tetratricopeptide repeat protein [Planktothrix agardhii]